MILTYKNHVKYAKKECNKQQLKHFHPPLVLNSTWITLQFCSTNKSHLGTCRIEEKIAILVGPVSNRFSRFWWCHSFGGVAACTKKVWLDLLLLHLAELIQAINKMFLDLKFTDNHKFFLMTLDLSDDFGLILVTLDQIVKLFTSDDQQAISGKHDT